MKKKALLSISVFLFVFITQMNGVGTKMVASNPTANSPVFQIVDLAVDGSITERNLSVDSSKFTSITEIIWILRFSDANWDWNNFAASSALTNGTDVFFGGNSLLNNTLIKKNNDFAYFSNDITVIVDGSSNIIIQSKWVFEEFIGKRLKINNSNNLMFQINDDLSAYNFTVTIKGCLNCYPDTEAVSIVNNADLTVSIYETAYTSGLTVPTTTLLNPLIYFDNDQDNIYYFGRVKNILLTKLETETEYRLHVGANARSGGYWENFTATDTSMSIAIKFDETRYNQDNNSLVLLKLDLYDNNDTFLESFTLSIRYVKEIISPGLINFIGTLSIFAIITSFLYIFVNRIRK